MRMEFKIRKMKKKDIRQVQQIAKTSWNHTYEGIIPFDSIISSLYAFSKNFS